MKKWIKQDATKPAPAAPPSMAPQDTSPAVAQNGMDHGFKPESVNPKSNRMYSKKKVMRNA